MLAVATAGGAASASETVTKWVLVLAVARAAGEVRASILCVPTEAVAIAAEDTSVALVPASITGATTEAVA